MVQSNQLGVDIDNARLLKNVKHGLLHERLLDHGIEDAISLVKMRLVKLKLPLILGMRTTTAATKTGANIWIRDPINRHISVDVFTRPRVRSNL